MARPGVRFGLAGSGRMMMAVQRDVVRGREKEPDTAAEEQADDQ